VGDGVSFTIDNSDEHCPVLRVRSGDHEISFTVKDVAPDSREWLGHVLDRQVAELVGLRVRQAIDAHQKELRKLLGVRDA
jgi:hypothetical protein